MARKRATTHSEPRLSLFAPARLAGLTLAVLSWSLTASRTVDAQILPFKPAAESGVAADSANGPDDPNEVEEFVADAADLPVWERQFFQAIETFDAAIATAEEEVEKAGQRSGNPLVRNDALREARQTLDAALRGLELGIHFRLADIKPGKELNRFKQEFELTLRSPTFPAHAYFAEVTVVISPNQARRLKLGSVVRAEGQLFEEGRRAFALICFCRDADSPPMHGDRQRTAGSCGRVYRHRDLDSEATIIGDHYTLDFHVDNVRIMSGKLLEEYQEFLPRYETRLNEYRSAAQSDAGLGPATDAGASNIPGLQDELSPLFP